MKIPLTQGLFAYIDAQDFALVSEYKWCASFDGNAFYAVAGMPGTRRQIRMHRLILDAPRGILVDHIDRNPLNNRRSNLRLATPAQNAMNTSGNRRGTASGHRGVYPCAGHSSFEARIQWDGRKMSLGFYETAGEAYEMYVRKSRELRGEWSPV